VGWFDDVVDTVTSTASSVYQGASNVVNEGAAIVNQGVDAVTSTASDTYDAAASSVSNWLGSGADTSDAATAGGGSALHRDEPDSLWGQIGQTVGDFGRGVQQEGLGGILDPTGAVDRQRAQRELSDRFQVVGDDHEGPRNHNQVTQAEYERIARTFSDVRMGRGDLTLDTSGFNNAEDAQQYREGAMVNIADMMMTTAGRDQISTMSNNVLRDDNGEARTNWLGMEQHRHTTIQPYFQEEEHWWQRLGGDLFGRDASQLGTDNAFAAPVDGSAMSRNADGTRGEGTDVNIQWNPGVGLGARSDVILAHEMEHALHETQGTMARGRFSGAGPDATYVDENGNVGINNFERQAVGLSRTDTPGGVPAGGHYPGDPDGCTENTYREQRNQLGLGDRFLPRTDYTSLPGQAATDAELQGAWAAHRAAQPAPLPGPTP
jgi:hypothetical protein